METLLEQALEHLDENATPYFILYDSGRKITANFETDNLEAYSKKLKYALKTVENKTTEIVLKSYLTPQSKNAPFVVVLREGVAKSPLDGLFPSVGDLSNPQLGGVSLGVQYGMQLAKLQADNNLLQQRIDEPKTPSWLDIAKEKAPAMLETLPQTEAGQTLLVSVAKFLDAITSKLAK